MLFYDKRVRAAAPREDINIDAAPLAPHVDYPSGPCSFIGLEVVARELVHKRVAL